MAGWNVGRGEREAYEGDGEGKEELTDGDGGETGFVISNGELGAGEWEGDVFGNTVKGSGESTCISGDSEIRSFVSFESRGKDEGSIL